MNTRHDIEENLSAIQARIEAACKRSKRDPSEITLVAVTKTHPVSKMIEFQEICLRRGMVPTFGENYVQEFQKKQEFLKTPHRTHFIGSLQRNKAKMAVELFDVIETVDSLSLAEAINSAAAKLEKTQEIYIQVNISSDENKGGLEVAEVAPFVENELPRLTHLRCAGLMTITKLYENPTDVRSDFNRLAILREELLKQCPWLNALHLSMGMSCDFEIAIEEGATVVRIGTLLFGSRI